MQSILLETYYRHVREGKVSKDLEASRDRRMPTLRTTRRRSSCLDMSSPRHLHYMGTIATTATKPPPSTGHRPKDNNRRDILLKIMDK